MNIKDSKDEFEKMEYSLPFAKILEYNNGFLLGKGLKDHRYKDQKIFFNTPIGFEFLSTLNYERVERLTISNNDIIKVLPERMRSLKKLKIKDCGGITHLPAIYTQLESLIIENSPGISKLPETYIYLTELNLTGCNKINILPSSYIDLTKLKIKDCKNIKELPESYKRLEILDIVKAPNIKYIPSSYKRLEKVYINGDHYINLWEFFRGEYSVLTELTFEGCSKLNTLPNPLGFPSLKYLEIFGKNVISSLPNYNLYHFIGEGDLIEQAKLLPSIKYINNKAV